MVDGYKSDMIVRQLKLLVFIIFFMLFVMDKVFQSSTDCVFHSLNSKFLLMRIIACTDVAQNVMLVMNFSFTVMSFTIHLTTIIT